MIVAGRFECTDDSSIITGKRRDEPIVLSTRVQNGQPTTALIRIDFNKDLVARLGDVDRYEHGIIRDRLSDGHGRSLRNEASNTFTLEMLRPTMAASCGARLPLERASRAAGSAAAPLLPRCYGTEFVARAVQEWIAAVGAKTAYIEPGSPWE